MKAGGYKDRARCGGGLSRPYPPTRSGVVTGTRSPAFSSGPQCLPQFASPKMPVRGDFKVTVKRPEQGAMVPPSGPTPDMRGGGRVQGTHSPGGTIEQEPCIDTGLTKVAGSQIRRQFPFHHGFCGKVHFQYGTGPAKPPFTKIGRESPRVYPWDESPGNFKAGYCRGRRRMVKYSQ